MKKLASFVSMFSAAAAFAAAEPGVNCIDFSTVGPDTYADGTVVADGECYALVWSADGAFEGIKADGTAVDAADRVLLIKALAKDGKCTPEIVQISKDLILGGVSAVDGVFAICVLDTRKYDGTVTDGQANFTVGEKNPINKAAVAVAGVKVSEAVAAVTSEGTAVAAGEAPLPAGIQPPTITAFEIAGDFVRLTVSGTSALANYAAQAGETPAADGAVGTPNAGNGTITLIAPKPAGNAGFFKVIRK